MVAKRGFDVLVASLLLVVLSPFLTAIAISVRIVLGKPILFRQWRPGLHGRPFQLLKFRTMADLRDDHGRLLPDAERLTVFGKLLRRMSVDELPELINILKGEMSLVGPRPLLMEYLPLYSPEQLKRHQVRPGITGWAQVNGRNAISWDEKFALDLWYVRHVSMLLDLKILWLTVAKVLKGEGVTQNGMATVERFRGPPQ